MRKFADKFNFTERISAEKAYTLLIRSTCFSKARREELLRNFNTFNANAAEVFWVKRSTAVQTRIITSKAAVDSMQAGYQEAQHEYQRHFVRANSRSSSASSIPEGEKVASDITAFVVKVILILNNDVLKNLFAHLLRDFFLFLSIH
jgi:hypothetical protein